MESELPYQYVGGNPVNAIDPTGLYSCFTDKQWPIDLLPICVLLDNSPGFRNFTYHNIARTMSIIGWTDTSIFLSHYLERTGSPMYLGNRIVSLIERDAAGLMEQWRKEYFSSASKRMNGKGGVLPTGGGRAFLSNAEGIPQAFASTVHPVSEELFIALGGFWLEREYSGIVRKIGDNRYDISLVTAYEANKGWNFRPNVEMHAGVPIEQVPENPPAAFGGSSFGIPDWLPRPGLTPYPMVTPFPMGIGSTVYFPDEWGLALEENGFARSFEVKGRWWRNETISIIDINCNGWDANDNIGIPRITKEFRPASADPTPYSTIAPFYP